jgi:hypothetical protein
VLQREYATKGWTDWAEELDTETLYGSYLEFVEQRRDRHPLPREMFGKFLIRMGAKPKRLTAGGCRIHGYSLGKLTAARAGFIKATGLQVAWSEP